MLLRKLSLVNFKNIRSASAEFSAGINCLVGGNGAGKTNILDAIYYLSMCKSALAMTDRQNLCHGEPFFVIEGAYDSDAGRHFDIVCSYAQQGGKKVKNGSKEYDRIADHVGLIPVVIVSPADAFLVSDAAEERRRYLNAFISQLDRDYLQTVMRYNAVLGERNRLLKELSGPTQEEILSVLDQQLIAHGEKIHARRAAFIDRLRPLTAAYYRTLSDDREQVELLYRSDLNDKPFEEVLKASFERDRINQFTTAGVHRDDLSMRIGGRALRKYGSQGQQKSFLIALKLAQYVVVADTAAEKPILLLDDLFDKLDTERVERLIGLVGGDDFGQIFISDCNPHRLQSILEKNGSRYALFRVEAGHVEPNP